MRLQLAAPGATICIMKRQKTVYISLLLVVSSELMQNHGF